MSNYCPKKFIAMLREEEIQDVDFRFTDLKGTWHHMSYRASFVTEDLITDGICFDGSSVSGWREIHQSDMLMMPDLSSVVRDPFAEAPTVIVICDVYEPATKKPYNRDPRSIAKKMQAYLERSVIADKAFFGPEPEFFVFDHVRFESSDYHSFHEILSDEFPTAHAKPLQEESPYHHGHRPTIKGGYFPVSPIDSSQDLRQEMSQIMELMGLSIEKHHHEVAPAQHELGFLRQELVTTGDHVQIYKYVVRNVAHQHGKTATFMPKPLYGDNGSGMHVHQSLWLKNEPVFAGDKYAGLSENALYYIGGILKHAKSLNAFTNPITNSYRRLVPGFEAPVICAYSAQNRSASCRIPLSHSKSGRRIEVRFPDTAANTYLALTSMLLAGLDGIENKIHPGDAMEYDLFHDEIGKTLPTVCGSLREALLALEADHDYLLRGDIFDKDFLTSYLKLKWPEVHAIEHRPHPQEFSMYYSV